MMLIWLTMYYFFGWAVIYCYDLLPKGVFIGACQLLAFIVFLPPLWPVIVFWRVAWWLEDDTKGQIRNPFYRKGS
jgi:hypothetical protein